MNAQADTKRTIGKNVSLADYVDQQIRILGLTKSEVAKLLGYERPNIVSMFTKGVTKIPLDKIPKLAEVLKVDQRFLLRKALTEYNPQLLDVFEQIEGDMLTENEREIITTIREINEADPALNTDRRRALEEAFQPVE